MSKEEMKNIIMYNISKELLKRMLLRGIITEAEYSQIDELNKEKYLPGAIRILAKSWNCS